MENIKTGATQFDSMLSGDEEIRVFENTAVVTGRVVLKGIYSGKESSGPYRFIDVWVKKQGRWQLCTGWVTAKGDISPPPVGQGEVTTQFRLEVVDGSGDFRKSRGFIVSVGTSTTTGSSNTYYGQVVVHPH